MDDGLVLEINSNGNGRRSNVLILIVVDDGLVLRFHRCSEWFRTWVLILIVVDDGLVQVDLELNRYNY